jgi:hypothetical protein
VGAKVLEVGRGDGRAVGGVESVLTVATTLSVLVRVAVAVRAVRAVLRGVGVDGGGEASVMGHSRGGTRHAALEPDLEAEEVRERGEGEQGTKGHVWGIV